MAASNTSHSWPSGQALLNNRFLDQNLFFWLEIEFGHSLIFLSSVFFLIFWVFDFFNFFLMSQFEFLCFINFSFFLVLLLFEFLSLSHSEFCYTCSFVYCHILNFVKFEFLNFVTFWVFEFYPTLVFLWKGGKLFLTKDFCQNLFFWLEIEFLSLVTFRFFSSVFSYFEFFIFVTFHILSFCVLSTLVFF